MVRKGVTFLEILVSALILATALAGMLATFVSVRKAVLRSDKRLSAFNLARSVLDNLYKEVREDTWESNGSYLSVGYTNSSEIALPPENITYNYTYEVSNVGYDYRKVTVTVVFPGED